MNKILTYQNTVSMIYSAPFLLIFKEVIIKIWVHFTLLCSYYDQHLVCKQLNII